MKKYIILSIIILTHLPAYSQSSWFWQQPLPGGNLLYDVKFFNSQLGFAVGKLGTIIKTSSGGNNWQLQNSNTIVDLQDVEFSTALVAIAVGASGTILRTSNGGINWDAVQSPVITTFFQVDFPTTNTGYIGGGGGVILKTTNQGLNWFQLTSGTNRTLICLNFFNENIGSGGGSEFIILTTNGGATWTNQNLSFDPLDQISGIAQIDSLTVVGACNSAKGSIYKTTNGGINWTITDLGIPLNYGNVDLVRDMSFGNALTGYIACDLGTIMKTTNTGDNWIRDTTFLRRYFNIGFFWGVNALDSGIADVVGGGETVVRSTNSGASWFITSGGKVDLSSNYFTDANTGYSVGKLGVILKTTDTGSTWMSQQSNTIQNLNDVHFVTSDIGYICGDTGVILKTTNGGTDWMTLNASITNNLYGIFFTDINTGTTVGNNSKILKTTNGGINWNVQISNGTTGATLGPVIFTSPDSGHIAGDDYLKTTNGGNNWLRLMSGGGLDIFFTDNLTGYQTGGSGIIIKTTNGGLNWFVQSGNVLENLNSIFFLNNNNGFSVGDNGAITRTTNGGLNWIPQTRITNNDLKSVYFVNAGTGYIAGDFGTLIKTTNGGLVFINSGNNAGIPDDYFLFQNYPNPFNSSTVIKYQIPKPSQIKIKLYNTEGKEIISLVNEQQNSGIYEILFDASNLSTGIYFYSLYSDSRLIETKKLILIK